MTGTLLKSEICPCNWKNNNICHKCGKKVVFSWGETVCVCEVEKSKAKCLCALGARELF